MAAPHVTGRVALLLASGVLGAAPDAGRGAAAPDRHRARSRRPRAATAYYASGLLDAAAALRGTKTPPPA